MSRADIPASTRARVRNFQGMTALAQMRNTPGFRGFLTGFPRHYTPSAAWVVSPPAPTHAPAPSAASAPAPAPAPVDPNKAGMDYLRSAYSSIADQARTDQASAQQQIDQLASLAGSGYAPGSVQDQAAKQQASTLAALSAASGAKFPSVLESAGVGAAGQYAMGANADRAKLTASVYSTDQQTLRDEMKQRQSIAAQLRGQNLNLLAAKLSQGGALTRAELAAATSSQNNAADNAAAYDRASLSATTSTSNTQARIAAQQAAAARKAAKAGKKAPSNADIRQWAQRAGEMWRGVPTTQTDPATGKTVHGYNTFEKDEIYRELIAQGAPKARALKIVRNVTGDPKWSIAAANAATAAFPGIWR